MLDAVSCSCSRTQLEQPPTVASVDSMATGLPWPDLPIGSDRQMYHLSALGRHGLISTAKFFSPRNLAVLAALSVAIDRVDDPAMRDKLRNGMSSTCSSAR